MAATMDRSELTYDFIVVGGGPCGSSLAARLSQSSSRPSVLLLEAGGRNEEPGSRVAGQRNTYWATPGGLSLDHGYKTTPQISLNSRELPYHRGKCLDGSTATNIGVWDHGSKAEHTEWARVVGDEGWSWENMREYYRRIETFHDFTPSQYKKYVSPDSSAHGFSGPVSASQAEIWDPTLPLIFDACEAHGIPLSPDLSSDKCLGMGVASTTVLNKQRVTASTAYLHSPRNNLTIMTSSVVEKVIFEGCEAKGVEVRNASRYFATKETILCAGAIDTPKILLLSGIGPSHELAGHGIDVVLDQPGVGKALQDHPMIRIGAPVLPGLIKVHPLAPSQEDMAAAAQGYLKLDPSKLPALWELDAFTQSYLLHEETPTHELLLRIVPTPGQPDRLLWLAVLVLMNCQSRGSVSLRSGDPKDAPLIDLSLFSSAYDWQVAVEAIRSTSSLLCGNQIIPTRSLSVGPKTLDTADIEDYIRSTATHLWHACGTVKMGKHGDEGTCVDSSFKFLGLQRLRVADLSIVPVIPSNHSQSTAYLIGEVAADKIIAEYRL